MPEQINTADEVIEALGGTTAVAGIFGVDLRVVSNWRRADRGLPPETFHAFQELLAAIGKTAPPSLWRQREVAP